MVLKLYGFPISTCTRLVALICKEKEIPYELIVVDLTKGEQKTPAFMQHQPFGVIPYIVCFATLQVCTEEMMMMHALTGRRWIHPLRVPCYLSLPHQEVPDPGTLGLIPTDLQAEAVFEQAASVEGTNFAANAIPLAIEEVFKPYTPCLQTNEARAAEYLATLNAKLGAYDVILGKQKYLAGETVTLADLQHIPFGALLCTAGHADIFSSKPNVARWWNELTSRPAWNAVKDGA
ncbi:glutathione S-transferase [Melanogaster broomeanus]|nr:glutathione S-transferase [Melanogaster broomeanus]